MPIWIDFSEDRDERDVLALLILRELPFQMDSVAFGELVDLLAKHVPGEVDFKPRIRLAFHAVCRRLHVQTFPSAAEMKRPRGPRRARVAP